MKKVLFIDCCIRKEHSRSKALADHFIGELQKKEEYEREQEEKKKRDINLNGIFTKCLTYTASDGSLIDTLPYWLYVPETADETTPIIVVLHCSYNKSSPDMTPEENLDNMVDASSKDIPAYIFGNKMGNIPAYIIMPQTDADSRGWSRRGDEVIELIEYCKRTYGVNNGPVNMIGYSMGGTGALEVAAAYPDSFDRMVVIAAGIDGVSNNTRPYDKEKGILELDDSVYPKLRVTRKNDSGKYEKETLKNLFSGDERYRAQTKEEISQATALKDQRISEMAECFNNSGIVIWAATGSKDTEADASVIGQLFSLINTDGSEYELLEGFSHTKTLDFCTNRRNDIVSFITEY